MEINSAFPFYFCVCRWKTFQCLHNSFWPQTLLKDGEYLLFFFCFVLCSRHSLHCSVVFVCLCVCVSRLGICWKASVVLNRRKLFFSLIIFYSLLLSQLLTRDLCLSEVKWKCGLRCWFLYCIFPLLSFFPAFYNYYRANKSTTKRTLSCQPWKCVDSHTQK